MPSASIFTVTRRFAVGELVTLYQLDLTPIGGAVYYFTNNVFPDERIQIKYDGNTYVYMPIAMESIDVNSDQGPPQPRLTIATSGGPVNSLVAQYNDLRGAKVTRIRTFAEFLDERPNGAGGVEVNPFADPNAYLPKDLFIVDRKVGANKTYAEFQLVAPTDQEGIELPLRVVSKRYCDLVYRINNGDGTFTYTGRHNPCPWGDLVGDGGRFYDINNQPCAAAQDACSKTLKGCFLRFKEGMDLEASSQQAVSSITRSGDIATLTTATPHGKAFGNLITVAGANETDYNGTFTVLSAPTTTTLTYLVANTPVTPATGTITLTGNNRPRHALPFNGFPGIRSAGEA